MKEKTQAVDSRWKMIFNGRKIEALYLWFVFMNQPDMAKYLCFRSRVRLFALVCNSLSMSYLNFQNQTVATLLAAEIYFQAAKKKQGLKEIAK
jgi:hypothetical protein